MHRENIGLCYCELCNEFWEVHCVERIRVALILPNLKGAKPVKNVSFRILRVQVLKFWAMQESNDQVSKWKCGTLVQ